MCEQICLFIAPQKGDKSDPAKYIVLRNLVLWPVGVA